jgi:hypothetical protein
MRELNVHEVHNVHAAIKFKWHINPVHVFYSAVGGFITAGPFGMGIAIGVAIAAEGTYRAHEEISDLARMYPYPEYTLGR